jgi:tetratricopeptide (TPR) repeat protein
MEGLRGDAQSFLEKGVAALQRGDNQAAEAAFKTALDQDPLAAAAYLGLAEVSGRRGNNNAAESWLKKGIKAVPQSEMLHRTQGAWLARRGFLDEAEKSYLAAVRVSKTPAVPLVALGEVYLARRSTLAKAEPTFRKALEADASSIPARVGLARALAGQRKDTEAMTVLEAAIRMAPADPMPLLTSARLATSRGRGEEALGYLQRAIDVAPDFLPAYLDKGDLHLVRSELDRAVETFRAAAAKTRQPAPALFRLGVALEAAQRWDEAERAYLDAVGQDPKLFGAYNNLAFMMAERKVKLDQAMAWIEKAAEIAPQSATVRDTKGWVFRARGNLPGAAELIQQAVKLDPNSAAIRYHFGVVLVELGRKPEAVASFKKSLELNPNSRHADTIRDHLRKLGEKA